MSASDRRPVHVFWDNSNIFISARRALERRFVGISGEVRVQFDSMYRLAHAGRTVREARSVGSVPPSQAGVWRAFGERTGIEPELFERGRHSGTEQAVDQALQVWMLRASLDHRDSPGIAVLMTGDGTGFHKGSGFFADLCRMHGDGWGIELVAWRDSCHGDMRSWAERVGVFIALDDYVDQVTFIEGLRPSLPLGLNRRPVAPLHPAQVTAQPIRS